MDVMDHDSGDSSEPSEILEHDGHRYEKKWPGNTVASDWVLWKCVEIGCAGQIATTAVRTKRWRRKRFTVQRDVASNRLTAFVPRRPHNHAPVIVHGKEEKSKQIGTTTAIAKLTPMTSPTTTTSLTTDELAAPSECSLICGDHGLKEVNEIDAFHSSESKSSLSLTDIENINSINLDNVSKSMENVEQTVTTFDDGIKMSNVNDTMEFQAVKPISPIDHQTNSKERHLKDISVTVNSTNIIKNIKNKNVKIKYVSTMANNDEMAMLFAIENIEQHERIIHVRQSRNPEFITDPFTYTDRLFIKNYRLTKELVTNLVELVRPYIVSKSRSSAIDLKTKVLVTLNFLATGSYQSPIGNSRFTAVSQPTVSRCISEVVAAINHPEIFHDWVKFPKNMNELSKVRNEFYRETGFPGVIGVIDCTHVSIVPSSSNLNLNENQNPEHIYVNRKGYHSINVQLICDSKLQILNVNALFPGSTHDVHIWNNSNVLPILQELYRQNYNNFYLLGDSGYPLRQWLLTPITNPTTNAEEYFNKRQMSTRSIIERCNGLLKMRFRCLLKDRTLHYKPEKSTAIINACTVLHNMCIKNNVPLHDVDDIEEIGDLGMMEDQVLLADNNRNTDLTLGRQQREKIVGYLFNRNNVL